MSTRSEVLWVEKYRPRELAAMVLDEEHRRAFEGFIKDRAVPHLMLVGSVGSGKTTVAQILVRSLDCTCLELNASDERGIDVIRERVKPFLVTAGFARWRIAFLDEADQLTPDSQFCLRNIMEQYCERGRFILTANHESKVIEAIRSRCQVMQFRTLERKEIFRYCRDVLKKESVQYDTGDLVSVVDDHYPDVRSCINALQLASPGGKLRYTGFTDMVGQVREMLKGGDLNRVRSFVMTHRPDFTMLYRGLFDTVDKLVEKGPKRTGVALSIAEYMYRDAIVADREVNFAAMCLEIMKE